MVEIAAGVSLGVLFIFVVMYQFTCMIMPIIKQYSFAWALTFQLLPSCGDRRCAFTVHTSNNYHMIWRRAGEGGFSCVISIYFSSKRVSQHFTAGRGWKRTKSSATPPTARINQSHRLSWDKRPETIKGAYRNAIFTRWMRSSFNAPSLVTHERRRWGRRKEIGYRYLLVSAPST